MVRFINSTPTFLYISAHSGGQAFDYSATQKTFGRATTYIAGGTHANYATPGDHLHGPFNILNDRTDSGALWDVTKNFRAFWFDKDTGIFSLAGGIGNGGFEEAHRCEGPGWIQFKGMWGDQRYPVPEHGQACLDVFGQEECTFDNGPTGESYFSVNCCRYVTDASFFQVQS